MKLLLINLLFLAISSTTSSLAMDPPRYGLGVGIDGIGIFAEQRVWQSISLKGGGTIVNVISPGFSISIEHNPKLAVFQKLYLGGSVGYTKFYRSSANYEIDNTFLNYNINAGSYLLPQIHISWYGKNCGDLSIDEMAKVGKIQFYVGRTFFLNTVGIKEKNGVIIDRQQKSLERRFNDRVVFGVSLFFTINPFRQKDVARR